MPYFKVGKNRLTVDDWQNVRYVQAVASKIESKYSNTGQWILQQKINLITKEHADELEGFDLVGYESFKIGKLDAYRAMYVKYGHFTWGTNG